MQFVLKTWIKSMVYEWIAIDNEFIDDFVFVFVIFVIQHCNV